ncbi:MAG: hypothetical protein HQL59_06640 [Magnetococcales bacterium]|nr:hypothetical protein [Magnetococcales bacterium]
MSLPGWLRSPGSSVLLCLSLVPLLVVWEAGAGPGDDGLPFFECPSVGGAVVLSYAPCGASEADAARYRQRVLEAVERRETGEKDPAAGLPAKEASAGAVAPGLGSVSGSFRGGGPGESAVGGVAGGVPQDDLARAQGEAMGRIMSDPALLQRVMALKDDPAFRKAVESPEIRSALERGDVGALTRDPRILELLSHPIVREIEGREPP